MRGSSAVFSWFIFVSAVLALTVAMAPAAESVIGNAPIRDVFEPGEGESVGSVIQVRGEAIIMHEGRTAYGFRAAEGLPLFQRDTLHTRADAMLSIALNDGSQMTLAGGTTIVISQSIYHPGKKARSSFIDMGLGKVRFFIRKLINYKQSDFKVKTRTAILGVRGSDFIVISKERLTEVLTLGETLLDSLSLAAPDKEPVSLRDFQRIVIAMGELPGRVMPLDRKDAESLRNELPIFQKALRETRGPEEKSILLSDEALIKPETIAGEGASAAETPEVALRSDGEEVPDQVYDNEDTLRDATVKENVAEATGAPDFPRKPETIVTPEQEGAR